MTLHAAGGALQAVRGDAVHCSFCPKMCRFACPVATATGREDATPWGLHTVVARLAGGRPADREAAHALRGCSGCLACQVACIYDLDLPRSVRAGRAAAFEAGVADPVVARASASAERGVSPFGTPLARPRPAESADVLVVAGCRDDDETVDALLRLLSAAGATPAAVVPDGCCGSALEDLGDRAAAARRAAALGPLLRGSVPVVATDPHCLPVLRRMCGPQRPVAAAVSELHRLAAAGRLRLVGPPTRVAYHDPCVLARGEGSVDPPRELLAAAGASLAEPAHAGQRTACSGGGMGLPLLAPGDAAAVGRERRAELADCTADVVLTACAGARRTLSPAGEVSDLYRFLAGRLEGAR